MSAMQTIVDGALIKALPVGLKAAIDRMLGHGIAPSDMLPVIRGMCDRAGSTSGDPTNARLVYFACEAYVANKSNGGSQS